MANDRRLQGTNWRTIKPLSISAQDIKIVTAPRPQERMEPTAATELRLEFFRQTLEARRQALVSASDPQNPNRYKIEAESDGSPCLIDGDKQGSARKLVWDGSTYNLLRLAVKENQLILSMYPIRYSEWTCCTNRAVTDAYESSGLNKLPAGLGVSVLLRTTDGFIPLSKRGIATPVYPGRLYSPGGGIRNRPTLDESFSSELTEETGLIAGRHFDVSKFHVVALVSDISHMGSNRFRPEFVATIQANITFAEFNELYLARIGTGWSQPDVSEYVAVPAQNAGWLSSFLQAKSEDEFCPPTLAGLRHLEALMKARTVFS